MQTADKLLIKVLFAVLCVLAALSLLATGVCAAAACLSDRDLYCRQTQRADYVAAVRASFNDELETVSLITELPLDKLVAAVSDEQLAAMSLQYAGAVCDYVTGITETLEPVTLPQDVFADAVAGSAEPEELTEELRGVLLAAVMPMGEGHLLGYLKTIVERVAPVVRMIAAWLPVTVVLLVLCLGGAAVLCYRRAARMYALSGCLWGASAFAAVAVWVFGSHPWMERLVLGDSALRSWIVGMFNTVVSTATVVLSVLFALCTVWLIASVVRCICQKKTA